MTTTKERIENDIKKNLRQFIPISVQVIASHAEHCTQSHVQLLMTKMTDLVEPGTKAFDAESSQAIRMIKKELYKGLVEYYKKLAK